MANELKQADTSAGALIEQVVVGGDLSKLTPEQRVKYYRDVCGSLGLNPLTRPFAYLTLNSKLVLYAQRDCTDQLRSIKGVSVKLVEAKAVEGVYLVRAQATDKTGRTDEATGAVSINALKGEALCNAIMKAETKAKRRVTLSICGLGLMDETELETVPGARPERIDPETGEIHTAPAKPKRSDFKEGSIEATAAVMEGKHRDSFGFPASDNIGPEPELPQTTPAQTDESERAEKFCNELIAKVDACDTAERIEGLLATNKPKLERAKAANEEAYDAVIASAGYRKRKILGAAA